MKKIMALMVVTAALLMATISTAGEVKVMIAPNIDLIGEDTHLISMKDHCNKRLIFQGSLKEFAANGWTIAYTEKIQGGLYMFILEKK